MKKWEDDRFILRKLPEGACYDVGSDAGGKDIYLKEEDNTLEFFVLVD